MAAVGRRYLRVGGETSCVEVSHGDTRLLLDLGTGAIALGQELVKQAPVELGVFLSHTHLDHVQGLPFFIPVLVSGWRVSIHGPAHAARGLDDVLNGTLNPNYSPLYGLGNLGAELTVRTVAEEELTFGDAKITTRYLPHGRVRSVGYRVELGGKVLAYLTDVDHEGAPGPGAIELARDADLLIHDAMNLPEEQTLRRGWGHSSPVDALAVAEQAGARQLLLFHHDPWREDDLVDLMVERARRRAKMPVDAARTGAVYEL